MKTSKLKLFSMVALFLIGLIAISGVVNADSVPVTIEKVWINDREVESGETRGGIVRGDLIEVEVKLNANGTDENVVVEATIEGLDHDTEKAEDKSKAFTVRDGKTYYKKLQIELPERIDLDNDEDRVYALRIEVSNRKDDEVIYNAIIEVDRDRNRVILKDVIFSPENSVKAGRALLTTVRLKNIGDDKEEDVKVKVSIPELGISASDYIDDLEEEDSVTSEELYMRIPECAEAGQYTASVTVEYDQGDEEVSGSYLIDVIEGDSCGSLGAAETTVVAVSTEPQTIQAGGSGAVYPLTLSNTGLAARTYTISSEAGDWAEVKISPSVAVLSPGETKVAYVYVSAKEDATAGEQVFGLTIKSGEETLKDITLTADVVEGKSGWDKVKKGLEVALVVLVVLLVIIGLIVGFNRLRGDERSDEEPKEETYY